MTKLNGLIAAVFTPFHADGSLHLERVGPVVEHLMGQGISAIFVNGSTGEGESLSLRERRDVAEAYVDAVDGRLPVIVQVGRNSVREAGELAAHAQGLGVFAIAATPPTYFPLDDLERVIDGLADIADCAPDTPLYYYHIPRLTGVPVNPLHMLELAAERLPTFAGIKYSDPSLDLFVRCVAEHGERYNILFGADEMLLAGMACGAHGAVGSTYNYMGPRYGEIIDAVERGDLAAARDGQARANRIVHAILRHPPLPGLKATMALAGVDCGPLRLPHRALAPEELATLERDLTIAGLLGEGKV